MAFLLHFLVLLFLSPHPAAYPYRNCEGGEYAADSLFQSNLNLLLSSFSSTNTTFVTDKKGSPPNRVYGLFLCRGDITSLPLCRHCALNATQDIQKVCPFSKQVTVWYDTCQLRYSDLSFNSSYYDIEPRTDTSEQKATDPDTFIKLRQKLLEKLCEHAAYNSSLLFATGMASVGANGSPEIYGLVQCTRDLSKDNCYQCLQENFSDILHDLDAVDGGRALAKSCNFRYEVFKFFEGVPAVLVTLPPSSPPPSSSTPSRRKDGKGMANPEEIPGPESLYFELSILKVATDNFSDFNKLGQGGFGAVYKGVLPNGQNIAVKKLSADSRQGIEELKNELLLVAKLQHRNLVRLRGICLEGGEKLLVYEYMPNGSLDKFLFGISFAEWTSQFPLEASKIFYGE